VNRLKAGWWSTGEMGDVRGGKELPKAHFYLKKQSQGAITEKRKNSDLDGKEIG